MASGISSTRCDVKVSAAIAQAFTSQADGQIETIEAIGRDDRTGIGKDIRRITVTNSINMPFGRFNIELAPRSVYQGKTWAEIIRPGSRVSIAFQRIGHPSDPFTNRSPVPLMVGTVDNPEMSEMFNDAAPQRTSRIMGRMLSSLLVEQKWWFHPILSTQSADGLAPTLPQFREFLLGDKPATDIEAGRETVLKEVRLLAIDPTLFNPTNKSPARCMGAAFRFFVNGTDRDAPFIDVNYADVAPLPSLLRFDEERAVASYFDPAARLLSAQLPTQLPNASCWSIFEAFNERPFQESFCEVRGDSLENAFVELVSRKPPFAGSVADPFGRASVIFDSGRRPALRGETLFDPQVGASSSTGPSWDRERDTIYVGDGPGGVIGTPTMRRNTEGEGSVYTLYYVSPKLSPLTGGQNQNLWGKFILPIIDDDPESPSYIRRFGVRPFNHTLNALPAVNSQTDEQIPDADLARRSHVYATLAREWLYRQPEMWSGVYQLVGNTNVRAGKRLVDVDRKMEFYITAVTHTIDNGQGGLYTTTAQVTRGWPIDNPV